MALPGGVVRAIRTMDTGPIHGLNNRRFESCYPDETAVLDDARRLRFHRYNASTL